VGNIHILEAMRALLVRQSDPYFSFTWLENDSKSLEEIIYLTHAIHSLLHNFQPKNECERESKPKQSLTIHMLQ